MPLINCPECGKQISDAASACPHCGYPIQSSNFIPQKVTSKRSTPLGEVQKNPTRGIIFMLLGIIGIPAVIYGFLLAVLPGILVLIGVIMLFGAASNDLSGTRKGTCPYCNGDITVTDLNASAIKCSHCKKSIKVKKDSLETID